MKIIHMPKQIPKFIKVALIFKNIHLRELLGKTFIGLAQHDAVQHFFILNSHF